MSVCLVTTNKHMFVMGKILDFNKVGVKKQEYLHDKSVPHNKTRFC